jgi:DNA-binding winged helix-turn-helix (wHTH) protein/TolB-like protein
MDELNHRSDVPTDSRPVERYVRFDEFTVDLRDTKLRRRDENVELPGDAFQVLVRLIDRAGRVVPREELRDIWPTSDEETFVDSLYTALREIRTALGDNIRDAAHVETVGGSGYVFMSQLERCGGECWDQGKSLNRRESLDENGSSEQRESLNQSESEGQIGSSNQPESLDENGSLEQCESLNQSESENQIGSSSQPESLDEGESLKQSRSSKRSRSLKRSENENQIGSSNQPESLDESESLKQSESSYQTDDGSRLERAADAGETLRSPMIRIGTIGFITRRQAVLCAVALFLGSVLLGMVVTLLWKTAAGAPSSARRTVVIRHFQNLTTDAREDSFCKGLSEELLAELSRKKTDSFDVVIDPDPPGKRALENLTSRPSIFELEGSVRKEGNTLRIVIELNELQSKRVMWAELYEGNEESPVPVQRDVAMQAAKGILTRL